MNRRQLIAAVASLPWVRQISALEGTPEAHPSTPALQWPRPGHFFTPLAVSVHDSLFIAPGPKNDRDVPELLHRVFEFRSDREAEDTFKTFPDQIASWTLADKYHELRWSDEVSIGDVGRERLGFLHKDESELQAVVLGTTSILHLTVKAPKATDVYSGSILPILMEDPGSIELAQLPPGWRSAWESEDVSENHIPD